MNKREYTIKHFTLSELIYSDTAERYHVSNIPSFFVVENLQTLCSYALEAIRDLAGCPLFINSGFRTQRVNELVGGSENSFHLRGQAADFTCNACDLSQLYDKISVAFPWLTECIYYPGKNFIHVAYDPFSTRHYFSKKGGQK